MSKHLHSFIERHPDEEKKIRSLAERSPAFSDLCTRFGRLWDTLNELENEPVNTEQVRREVKHLEREMLFLVHDQLRV